MEILLQPVASGPAESVHLGHTEIAEKMVLGVLNSDFCCHDSICQPPAVTTTRAEPEIEGLSFFSGFLITFQDLLLAEPNGKPADKGGWKRQFAH